MDRLAKILDWFHEANIGDIVVGILLGIALTVGYEYFL
jgi:predicted negative regulator of RcsB-dependent stress response